MEKRKTNRLLKALAFFLCFVFLGQGAPNAAERSPKHTKEASQLLRTLRKAARRKTPYLGHQDALMYGQAWSLNKNDSLYINSDIYEVCGQYPFILGLDLGRIEAGGERNIDGCLFKQMKEAAIMHNQRGGVVTISWHMDNPLTDGSSWDHTSGDAVQKILNDSLAHKKFISWLDMGADFMNQLENKKGKKIPILFRPFHECNIETFWWSKNSCSEEEYIALWRMTYDYLVNEKDMKQLLWVYSPYNVHTESEISIWYPGNESVDVIGFERYQSYTKTYDEGIGDYLKDVKRGMDVTVNFAKPRAKIVAFSETGYQGVPYDNWWTEGLWVSIVNQPLAYVHLWRNGTSKSYYFGPCLTSESSNDFKKLVTTTRIKLLNS